MYNTFGRPHGSSKSHCERRKTSSKPMNNINVEPPHVEANFIYFLELKMRNKIKICKIALPNVGPIGGPGAQSQATICKFKWNKKKW